MKFPPNFMARVALAATLSLCAAAAASAAFPDRPIRLIVPFTPGGAGDIVGRLVAERMSEKLGQQIIVDFRAGAATIIGADYVNKAEPDGYTLLLGTATTFVVNPIIYQSLPYNAKSSYDPIGVIGSSALALLANTKVPAKNFKELMELVKADPGIYSYGSHGSGSTVHFVGEMLWSAAKADVLHVPYKGSAPALTDLMGGQIPLAFDSVPAAASAQKSGKVTILATTGKTRSPLLPDVPTIAESGYPDVSLEAWWAIVAPKGVPDDTRLALEKALSEALADPVLQEKLLAIGFAAKYGAPATYLQLIKEDTAKLAPIAEANGIKKD